MQQDLDAAHPELGIAILGVNAPGYEPGNDYITSGRDIPWLQDVAGASSAWDLWQVVYRDVVVVGPDGAMQQSFNLTTYDLAAPENYAALRSILIEAAPEPSRDGLAAAAVAVIAALRALARAPRTRAAMHV